MVATPGFVKSRVNRTYIVGSSREGLEVYDSFNASFYSGSEIVLRDWFRRNTGPTMPPQRYGTITGEQVVTSQDQADALAGQVIRDGWITVGANSLRIHDVYIFPNNAAVPDGGAVINVPAGRSGIEIDHNYIDGQQRPNNNKQIGGGTNAGVYVHHNHITGHSDGIRYVDGGRYEYNFVHDPMGWNRAGTHTWDVNNDPHSDASQGIAGTWTAYRNYLENPAGYGSNVIACVSMSPTTSAGVHDCVWEENYFNGGGAGTISSRDIGFGLPKNLLFLNNLFGISWSSTSGPWSVDPGITWTRVGNRYVRSLRPIPLTLGTLAKPAAGTW